MMHSLQVKSTDSGGNVYGFLGLIWEVEEYDGELVDSSHWIMVIAIGERIWEGGDDDRVEEADGNIFSPLQQILKYLL